MSCFIRGDEEAWGLDVFCGGFEWDFVVEKGYRADTGEMLRGLYMSYGSTSMSIF